MGAMPAAARVSICRGCGGTGIDASVSPRAAQAASVPVLMRRDTGVIDYGGTSNVARIAVAGSVDQGRMKYYGPLVKVCEHIDRRLRDGYVIVSGDRPDQALACRWCNGHGTPDGQLTVHALENLSQK